MNDVTKIAIVIYEEEERVPAEALAKQLSIPILNQTDDLDVDYRMFFDQGILKLSEAKQLNSAVWIDFSSGKTAYRQKHQGKGKLPISRACGIKNNHRPTIIDATAGLGQDAFVLAGLDCPVICIEQNPFLATLLADGLTRAKSSELWVQNIVKRMQLQRGRAEDLLKGQSAEVIYLDPMYPHQENKKTAKVKKGMQLFRAFPGTESDESSLLEAAIKSAIERVVVKRPDWASSIKGVKPSHQIPGKNHRYDVYML